MSTYAVFGMTRTKALADARKRVKTYRKDGANVINLTEQEWLEAVEAEVAATMKGGRTVQLSDKYSAPVFAKDYLRLCQKTEECRDLHIKAQKRSATPDPKTGRYKFSWEEVTA